VYEFVERDQRTMIGSRHVQTRRSPLAMDKTSTPAARSAGTTEDYVALQEDNGLFRRTVIRRNQETMKKTGTRVAEDAMQIRDPELPVPPTFQSFCAQCEFKVPCDAMESGGDWQAILDAHFYQRAEDSEEDSLRHSDHRTGTRASLGGMFRVINLGHR
jgi:hypothetical protein